MSQRKILIVDDIESNRAILRRYLEDEYEIIEACDGEEAIQVIQEEQLNLELVLLDLVMPKKNGFDVLEYMNEFGFIPAIPVIIITVESNYENEMKAFEFGVNDFITKPFYPQIVRKRVKNIIDLYETQQNLKQLLDEQVMDTVQLMEELEGSNG